MFNIYYLNYAKAYEIAMLLDNKILDQITKEHNSEGNVNGNGELNADMTVIRYRFSLFFEILSVCVNRSKIVISLFK